MSPTKNRSRSRWLLANKNFLALWASQIASQLADKIVFVFGVALLATVSSQYSSVESSHVSLLYVGLVTAFLIPAILGLFIGVFIDRASRKSILFWSNVIRVGVLLLIPLWHGNIWLLYILMFFVSLSLQFFAPSEAAIMPTVVRAAHLMIANSLFSVTTALSMIVGFVFADPLIQWAGLPSTHLWIAGAYTFSALMILLIDRDTRNDKDENYMESLREGLTYIRAHPYIMNSIIQVTVVFAILSSLVILMITFTTLIGIRTQAFGTLLAPATVGFLIGAWIVNIFHRLHPKVLSVTGFIIIGIFIWAISVKPDYTMTLLYSFIIGVGVPVVMIPIQTYLQRNIRNEMRGKVFGLQSSVLNIVSVAPMVLTGILADTYGVASVLGWLGGFVIIAGIGLNLMKWKRVY